MKKWQNYNCIIDSATFILFEHGEEETGKLKLLFKIHVEMTGILECHNQ